MRSVPDGVARTWGEPERRARSSRVRPASSGACGWRPAGRQAACSRTENQSTSVLRERYAPWSCDDFQVDGRAPPVQLVAHVVGNPLVFAQWLQAGALHRAAVNEDVLGAIVGADEAVAPLGVERSHDAGGHGALSL